MLDRLDLAVDKGCDGVEPDNMDGFTNRTGFRLSEDDQLGYNRRLANEAHLRDLSAGEGSGAASPSPPSSPFSSSPAPAPSARAWRPPDRRPVKELTP